MIKQDSAKFWFPKLAADPWVRDWLPKTIMIDYNEEWLVPSLRGQATTEYTNLYLSVEAAIRYEISGPAFIRTDITSAKHAGRAAYVVNKTDELNHALLTTLSHAELKSYHQKVKSSAIMVRPLLHIKADRTAFGGLPIGKEWRVFANQTGTRCFHGYWPEEALIGHMDDGKPPDDPKAGNNWAKYWMSTDALEVAVQAAKLMGEGEWSVDFAEDVDGKIWLLDMATAGNSFHHPICPRQTA